MLFHNLSYMFWAANTRLVQTHTQHVCGVHKRTVSGVQICIRLANDLKTHSVAQMYVRDLPVEASSSRKPSQFSLEQSACTLREILRRNQIKQNTRREELPVMLGFPVTHLSDTGGIATHTAVSPGWNVLNDLTPGGLLWLSLELTLIEVLF